MSNRKKKKQRCPPRYEVTAKIDGIGVRTHVMSLPASDAQTLRDDITGKLHRVYPNRDAYILRIVERR